MKIELADLQKALDVLRAVERYDFMTAAPGELGAIRADAFLIRSRIETALGVQEIEVAA